MTAVDTVETSLPERLSALGDEQRREVVLTRLREFYREVARRPEPDAGDVLTLDSLAAVQLGSYIELGFGVEPPVDDLFGEFTLAGVADRISAVLGRSGTAAGSRIAGVVVDPANRHEPFPLTAIQQAYLLGRSGLFELGDVSTHAYLEFEQTDLDLDRLTTALHRLITRHDMLRAVVTDDGRQRVLPEVPPYDIVTTDLRGASADQVEAALRTTRDELSHQVVPADRWPLFDIRATRLDGHVTRLHLSIDLLIADGASIAMLLRDWSRLYRSPDTVPPPPDLTFRDYVLALEEVRGSERYEKDTYYWISRLADLPSAPELPYRSGPQNGDNRFVRRARGVDAHTWEALRRRAAEANLTPSALLCAAFAEVLTAWSKDPRFAINVTLGERLPLHPQVTDLVGDFTSSTLLAVDATEGRDFVGRATRLQAQLRRDLEHRLFSGVEVLRELARQSDVAPSMPVVFTSMLGIGLDSADLEPFAEPAYAVSQTPQVLLDYQVLERDGRLEISWDAVESRFLPGVLDAMFDAHCDLLERLANGEAPATPGELLPAPHRRLWAAVNASDRDHPTGLLHEPIARWVDEHPDAPAVIATDRTLSYADLDRVANRVARLLRRHGVRPNQLVGVVMHKGWEQVAAVLGILRAGAAYLPIDAALPPARIARLLDRGEVRVALTQSWVDGAADWPTGLVRMRVDALPLEDGESPVDCPAGPDDLAYVIFTSGSTGEPKGVMIEHRSALNTVLDVNTRFGVTTTDRALALSSLSFDLSVYDIFGVLAAGGTIVVPDGDAERDPGRWAELVRRHRVTIWNSVPALLGLLADYADGRPAVVGPSLRLALLSGDWIPTDLPGRVRSLAWHADMISLGGATEGSIWSILHPVTQADAARPSIPYGRAMANQTMHVLGPDLEPRPAWVPGEIHIGGAGVAAGYWRDPDRTAEQFVTNQRTGARLYRTGDLGRLLPDGGIELLGRVDHQVKIRGYRVEPGEIEAVIAEHSDVRVAAVVAKDARRLVAHVVPHPGAAVDESDLRLHVQARLPDYMVPSTFVTCPVLPLTGNGKVDRAKLAAQPLACELVRGEAPPSGADDFAESDVGQTLARVWCEVLGAPDARPDDEFYHLGGDSLLALRLVARLGAKNITITARDILSGATFGDLCRLARVTGEPGPATVTGPATEPVTGEVPLTPSQLWFLEQDFADAHHWNGMWPLILVTERLDPVLLGAAVHRLVVHHDMLRTRFRRTETGWRAVIEEPGVALPVPFSSVDLSTVPDGELSEAVERTCTGLQASLDLENGPLIRVSYLDLGPHRPPRLHVAAHWAAVDYYSSRVLVEDLLAGYAQLADGDGIRLPAKTLSVVDAGTELWQQAATDVGDEVDYWLAPERVGAAEIPYDHRTGPNVQESARRVLLTLGRAETTRLTRDARRLHGCEPREVILAALGRALATWTGRDSILLDVEGHGREDVVSGDISRTVGRFSTLWPLLLRAPSGPPAEALADVARQVRTPRDRGIWHGLLRYLRDDPQLRQRLAELPPPEVGFNYWGQVDEYFTEMMRPSTESPGPHRGGRGHRPRPIDVLGFVAGGELALVWSYSRHLHRPETVQRLAERTIAELRVLLECPGDDARALHVDEQRPLQFDDVWSLAGLAGLTDPTEESP